MGLLCCCESTMLVLRSLGEEARTQAEGTGKVRVSHSGMVESRQLSGPHTAAVHTTGRTRLLAAGQRKENTKVLTTMNCDMCLFLYCLNYLLDARNNKQYKPSIL